MGTLGKARRSGTPSPATTRKIQLLVALMWSEGVSIEELRSKFDVSERTLLRDLQELHAIGEAAGFRITRRRGRANIDRINV